MNFEEKGIRTDNKEQLKIKNNGMRISSGAKIKRFYPPAEITDMCPECGGEVENNHYMGYPQFNPQEGEKSGELVFGCVDCPAFEESTDVTWARELIIQVKVKK